MISAYPRGQLRLQNFQTDRAGEQLNAACCQAVTFQANGILKRFFQTKRVSTTILSFCCLQVCKLQALSGQSVRCKRDTAVL